MHGSTIEKSPSIRIDLPPLPGLSYRAFGGEADFASMAELIARCHGADDLDYLVTAEDIANYQRHLPDFNPQRDMILVESGDRLIAYGRVVWHQQLDGLYVYRFHFNIDPGWRGKGLGEALLGFFERRAAQIAAGHPEGPSTHPSPFRFAWARPIQSNAAPLFPTGLDKARSSQYKGSLRPA
jgi:GNAT superfamily N-acetyltransferase